MERHGHSQKNSSRRTIFLGFFAWHRQQNRSKRAIYLFAVHENLSKVIKLQSVSVATSLIPLGINRSTPCYVTNRRKTVHLGAAR
jgi:hypothetical protein